jgi:hypothetical protein
MNGYLITENKPGTANHYRILGGRSVQFGPFQQDKPSAATGSF